MIAIFTIYIVIISMNFGITAATYPGDYECPITPKDFYERTKLNMPICIVISVCAIVLNPICAVGRIAWWYLCLFFDE